MSFYVCVCVCVCRVMTVKIMKFKVVQRERDFVNFQDRRREGRKERKEG